MSIYLVDGHALAYRSYYAFIRRPLVNSRGEETSAVFGFTKTMLMLFEKFQPTHVAVVFDSSETTFRKELFDDYKAHRPKTPESLLAQLPRIMEVLEGMGIPCLSLDGYEADDVIATMASQMESGEPVRIVSGDKDLFQVVSERTHIIRPGKNGVLDEEVDPDSLQERFGLSAGQFVDYQALMGDATDNIPGVPGIGEKTALKLIKQFGSLEKLYASLDEVSSASLRAKLENGRDKAELSRKLVTLDRSAPVDVDLRRIERGKVDRRALRKLFRELEFNQFLESLGGEEESEREVVDYVCVDDEARLRELATMLAGTDEFAIDVETSDRDPMRAILAGISVATEEGKAWYVPVTSSLDQELSLLTPTQMAPGLDVEAVHRILGPVLADAGVGKTGQNIKYDAIVLWNAGLELHGITFDTMIASYCLHPGRRSHGLDALADDVFGHKMISFKSLFDTRAKTKDIRNVPLERVTEYAAEDADYTLRLKNYFAPLLDASNVHDLFESIEMPLSEVLTRMEIAGVRLDVPFLGELSVDVSSKLEKIQRRIFEEVGEEFNINSTAKLQEVLFQKLGLKPSSKTKTGYSTDNDVLQKLTDQHVVPELVIEYRTLSKLKGTYIDALPRLVNPRTGRVHTSYNQAVATTGRLSSSDPNLQNIPIRTQLGRSIRKAFVAGDDARVLLDADYSQIELRIMAHLSQDAELLRAFKEGADVHRRTAARMLGVTPEEVSDEMRSRAKTVNFGIIYGMGARGLAQSLGIDVKEAKQFIDDYFAGYPGVRRFIDETIARAEEDKAVSTLLGRVRHIAEINSPDRRTQSFARRVAVNTPIQGTAADIIKVAMIDIQRELEAHKLETRMILQVHDELLFDVPKDELPVIQELVRERMENAMQLDVPLKVDMGVGVNWLEAHG